MRYLLFVAALSCFAQSPTFPTAAIADKDAPAAGEIFSSTLQSTINETSTSISVASGTRFRAYQIVRIDSEKIYVCGVTGNVLNVCTTGSHGVDGRGYAGTTAARHTAGAAVRSEVDPYTLNKLRAEIKAMQANTVPIASVSSLPAVPTPGCTPNGIYIRTSDNTLHQCNGSGTGYAQISGAVTTEGYVASITISSSPYAISEATHAQGMWPMTRLFSSGEQVAASIKLTSMSTNGNVSITAAAGTYIVVIRDGGPTSAYHGTVTLSGGTATIAEGTHKQGKYPFLQFWNGSGELVTLKQTWASPGTNGNVNLAGADGTYEVSAATGSAVSGGGAGVTDHAALSNLPYGDSGHTGFVGATGLTPADNDVAIHYSGAWHVVTLPSCSNATTSKLLYNNSTHAFSCGTDQNSGGGTTYVPDGTARITINTGVTPNELGVHGTVMETDADKSITAFHSYKDGQWEGAHRLVSELPACSTIKWLFFASDATSSSDCSVGGGTNHVSMCYCNGAGAIWSLGGH